jgi:hypothetical protein
VSQRANVLRARRNARTDPGDSCGDESWIARALARLRSPGPLGGTEREAPEHHPVVAQRRGAQSPPHTVAKLPVDRIVERREGHTLSLPATRL